jgi:hypothetical protein
VPLSLLLVTAFVSFGGFGLGLGYLLPGAVAAGVAVAATFAALALVSRVFARFVRPVETYALPLEHLVGRVGVAELDIDPRFGVALVNDDTGSLMQIRCRSYALPIRKGEPVLLTEFDPDTGSFTVERSPI